MKERIMNEEETCKNTGCPYYDEESVQFCNGETNGGSSAEMCLDWRDITKPAPDLPALLKRCKPWLDVMRKEYSMRTTREITELDALLSDIAKAEARNGRA